RSRPRKRARGFPGGSPIHYRRSAVPGGRPAASRTRGARRRGPSERKCRMVSYNPFAHEIIHGDPHPIYKRLRDEAPAYYIERYDCWALSRFADVWAACDDLNVSSARGSTAGHLLTKIQPLQRMLNTMDPPDH